MITITRTSPLTGKVNAMDLDVSLAQLDELAHPGRRAIQHIFPDLSDDEREFLKTGHTKEDWDVLFPPEGDE